MNAFKWGLEISRFQSLLPLVIPCYPRVGLEKRRSERYKQIPDPALTPNYRVCKQKRPKWELANEQLVQRPWTTQTMFQMKHFCTKCHLLAKTNSKIWTGSRSRVSFLSLQLEAHDLAKLFCFFDNRKQCLFTNALYKDTVSWSSNNWKTFQKRKKKRERKLSTIEMQGEIISWSFIVFKTSVVLQQVTWNTAPLLFQ